MARSNGKIPFSEGYIVIYRHQTIELEIFLLGLRLFFFFEGGRKLQKFLKKCSGINTTIFFLSSISNSVMAEICQKVLEKFVEIVETSVQIDSSRKF